MAVGAPVALHAHAAHVGEQHDRALPHLAVQAGGGELLAGDGVGPAQDGQAFGGDLADDADAEAGTREGLSPDDLLRHAELEADAPDLVLEQRPQGLDQAELEVVGQPAHVVVALDGGRPVAAPGLDHVRVQGPLDEELDGLALLGGVGDHAGGGLLEDTDELPADHLALGLGVGHAGQGGQEPLGGVHHDQVDPGGCDEVLFHLRHLALAQQAVVDEHAGEPVPDGPLDQRGGDG